MWNAWLDELQAEFKIARRNISNLIYADDTILMVESQEGLGKHHYKASGGDGIPAKLFKVLKDDAVKVLHSICQQIWKTQQWPQDWDRSVFIPILKKGNAKQCSNCAHLTC